MDFNQKAAVAAGYAPYVMSVAKELPASVQFGSVTTVAGYRVTTPENERNALGYFPMLLQVALVVGWFLALET